jgi:hypothetical protein
LLYDASVVAFVAWEDVYVGVGYFLSASGSVVYAYCCCFFFYGFSYWG